MIVVVGGASRKAGKTTVMCELIRATREARWVAVKITPHAHTPSPYGDTERYLDAGAIRAILAGSANDLPLGEGNLIIESNSILDVLTPDLFIFVEGSGEWKPSAHAHAGKADHVVRGHVTEEIIERIRALLSAQRS